MAKTNKRVLLRYAHKLFKEARAKLLKKGFGEDDWEPHNYQAEGGVYPYGIRRK